MASQTWAHSVGHSTLTFHLFRAALGILGMLVCLQRRPQLLLAFRCSLAEHMVGCSHMITVYHSMYLADCPDWMSQIPDARQKFFVLIGVRSKGLIVCCSGSSYARRLPNCITIGLYWRTL